ncbi:MAG: cytidylate kinase-like family protein [Eubacteriales bacterium]|nr:cytidylate kinase-like family protein [Eubacteriales bacterium]
MNRIITISREFGSGGRELGRLIAAKLGYAYYDKEIVSRIAERSEMTETYVQNVLEQKPFLTLPIHVGVSLEPTADPLLMQSQELFQLQCSILKEVAEKSDCVIVGRCADYILSDCHPFRIFVYAEMESRLRRCRETEGVGQDLSDRELRNQILGVDRQRSDYYEFCTGNKWSDRLNYDICVNSTNIPLEELAESVAMVVRASKNS